MDILLFLSVMEPQGPFVTGGPINVFSEGETLMCLLLPYLVTSRVMFTLS